MADLARLAEDGEAGYFLTIEMMKNDGRIHMKVNVDQNICIGSQDCVNACPEVFKMEGEKAVAHVAEVPKGAEDKCRTASDACPAGAISIEN